MSEIIPSFKENLYRQKCYTILLKLCLCEPPHPPGVPVLVADLLLHLRVGERLEEGRPRVGVALVAEGQLDDGQVVVAERVRLLVPRNLQKELLD